MYQESDLAQSNRAYADHLVERDLASLPPLQVEGGEYASDFGTQVRICVGRCWEKGGGIET